MRDDVKQWARSLCLYAGENDAFYVDFVERMSRFEDVYKEFEYYFDNGSFLGALQVAGMTLVDIMIWQMDHFKSDLDRGLYDMQSNPDKMVLMAFDTMLNLKIDPEKIILKFGADTGTDYPGKF